VHCRRLFSFEIIKGLSFLRNRWRTALYLGSAAGVLCLAWSICCLLLEGLVNNRYPSRQPLAQSHSYSQPEFTIEESDSLIVDVPMIPSRPSAYQHIRYTMPPIEMATPSSERAASRCLSYLFHRYRTFTIRERVSQRIETVTSIWTALSTFETRDTELRKVVGLNHLLLSSLVFSLVLCLVSPFVPAFVTLFFCSLFFFFFL
jgi:hypothetical protein